ncbi:hypothetical protein Droror1_Dr00027903 [Drosera rotundifolia]
MVLVSGGLSQASPAAEVGYRRGGGGGRSSEPVADSFQMQGRLLRWKMWFQNFQLKLIVSGSMVAFILIVWVVACGGFKC